MIGLFLPLAAKLVGNRFPALVKPLAWLGTILSILAAMALIFSLAKCAVNRHDRSVEASYENKVQAQVANEVAAGTNAADAKDNIVAAQDAERANQIHADIGNAVTAHPVEAHHATGPASQAALDRLRQRRK